VRGVYLAIIIVFVAAAVVFSLQNTQSVSVAFLGLAVSAPVALIVFVAYLLGAATGGSLYVLLRASVKGSRRPSA
jgi:uncharacterized integral membrane protein